MCSLHQLNKESIRSSKLTTEEAGQQNARVQIRETALVDRVSDHVEHASEPDAEVLREAEVEPCAETDRKTRTSETKSGN